MRLLPALAIVLVASLAACVSPQILSANDRGGIVKFANGSNSATTFSVADAYCHQRNRVAQITGTDEVYNQVTFACVEP